MVEEIKAKSLSKAKDGPKLHTYIAVGGKPKERKNANSWKGGK